MLGAGYAQTCERQDTWVHCEGKASMPTLATIGSRVFLRVRNPVLVACFDKRFGCGVQKQMPLLFPIVVKGCTCEGHVPDT